MWSRNTITSLLVLQTCTARILDALSTQAIFTEGGPVGLFGKNNGDMCNRNYDCNSGCCDYGRGLPFLGHCGDPGDCWVLDTDTDAPATQTTRAIAEPEDSKCKHELDFGSPAAYKLKVGDAYLAKISNRIGPDPYGGGDVFYSASKGLGIAIWTVQDGQKHYLDSQVQFSTYKGAAATWNATVSQYGRRLALLDRYERGVIARDLSQSRNPLVRSEYADSAVIFQFTRYVEPTWTLDAGSTRSQAMFELVEKLCKPDDDECPTILYEYLQPGKIEQFLSCK